MTQSEHDPRVPARVREDDDLTEVQMEICQRLMLGESVRRICRDDHMPVQSTVFQWLVSNDRFRAAYELAKRLLAETLSEEILDISDDGSSDFTEGESGKTFNPEHVQRSKLRVDSRKWLAAKLAPKRYGDSTAVRVGGMGDLDGRSDNMTTEERAVRLAAIMRAVEKRKGGS